MDSLQEINGYISQSDWRVRENSNSNYSFAGLQGHLAGEGLTEWALSNMYLGEVASAHADGLYHIHDISHPLVGYCAGWDLIELIQEGFNCGNNYVYSSPAEHLDALYGQLNNFLFTMSGEWAGAQAINSFDTYSSAFIKADNLDDRTIKRTIRRLIFDLNVKTRIAMQAPFSNISIDLRVPDDLRDKKAIIGGKEVDFTYGDCQPEMDRFNILLTEVMMEGDGMNKIFTFPIITYSITKDFPWGSKLSEAIFRFADEANSPYFSNFINSEMDQTDVRSMCCRLRLDLRELIRNSGGLFGSGSKTGSNGVVTLNLSKMGYMSRVLIFGSNGEDYKDIHQEDYDKAYEILNKYQELRSRVRLIKRGDESNEEKARIVYFTFVQYFMDLARKSLLVKRDAVQESIDSGRCPYTKKYLGNLNNHFNTIGVNGGNEGCINLLGCSIADPEGKKLAEETLDYILNRLADYQEMDHGKLLWNLEATPAEGCSTRFAKVDKSHFRGIITGGGDKDFYTNSTQLPEDFSDNIFEVLDHQDSLQTKYTSGTVLHLYTEEPTKNWRSIESLVRKIFTNYQLPYISISPDICVCPIHGRLDHTYEYCPHEHDEADIKALIEKGILQEELYYEN